MTDMTTLIDRVRALKGPDREVDAMAWCFLRGKKYSAHWPVYGKDHLTQVQFTEPPKQTGRVSDGRHISHAHPLTASVDAVLGLIGEKLPAAEPGLVMEGRAGGTQLWLAWMGTVPDEPDAFAPTPALALLLAFLNAWNTENEHDL